MRNLWRKQTRSRPSKWSVEISWAQLAGKGQGFARLAPCPPLTTKPVQSTTVKNLKTRMRNPKKREPRVDKINSAKPCWIHLSITLGPHPTRHSRSSPPLQLVCHRHHKLWPASSWCFFHEGNWVRKPWSLPALKLHWTVSAPVRNTSSQSMTSPHQPIPLKCDRSVHLFIRGTLSLKCPSSRTPTSTSCFRSLNGP